MVQQNGSLSEKITQVKKERMAKRKEVLQDTAELKNLQAKKRRLQRRAAGMTRNQMQSMWDVWQEAEDKRQAKKRRRYTQEEE